jgi:hypothetical protein
MLGTSLPRLATYDTPFLRGLQQGLRGEIGGDEPVPEAAEKAARKSKANAEGGIAGSGEGRKPPRKPPKRTSLDRIPGRRPMKEYPVNGEELLTLGIMQGGAAILLAFAGACFGFSVSTKETIAFAGKDVPQATIGWWSGIGDGAFYLAIIVAVLGLALGVLSGLKVRRIMKATDHG